MLEGVAQPQHLVTRLPEVVGVPILSHRGDLIEVH
jgi:hypothetical protein